MALSKQIIEVLDDLCKRFGIAIDWTQENIVPYVQELCGKYIRYEICTSIAWCAIAAVILIVMLAIMRASYKHDVEELFFASMIFTIPTAMLFLFVVGQQTFDIIECLTIPEKTLIEFISALMKRN